MSRFSGSENGDFNWGRRIRRGKPVVRCERGFAAQRARPLSGLEVLEPRLLLAFSPLTGPLHGSQAAWVDYDNDGWPDVSTDFALYKNNSGDGTFTQLPGLGEGVWGDYDNDGYPDLFRWADPNSIDLELWHNNNGTGFTDVTSLLPTYPGNFISRGAAWGDFNGDAYLDLYIGGFEGSGSYFADSLLINNAGQSFTASWIQGLDAVVSPGNPRPARGISTLDFDEDGDLDIYVSNYRLEPNALWQNDGNGNITDVGVARGVAGDPGGSYPYGHTISSAVGDIDNDGHIDIFVGNFRHPWGDGSQDYAKFLRNLGPGGGVNFQLMDELDGNDWQESYASASLADYDNDGDLDLHFTAVYPGDTARLYRNDGNWNFTNVTGTVNLTPYQQNTYQSAWADFDNDGDLDLLTGERLNINDASQQTSNNWLKVKLIGDGDNVNTSAIGAVVRVQAGGQTITRQVESATGEANGNDQMLHFGLGNVSTPVTVDVTWPDGTVTSSQQTPNEFVTLPYGRDRPDAFKAFGEREIGEVGQITNLTHEVQTVTLNRVYDNPVVFAQSVSNNGSAPVSVRVKNVHSDQFDIYLTEPSNENGTHHAETANYIVLEAGVHTRSNGTRIEVGTVNTPATVGRQVQNQWQIVNFDSPFSSVPVVLSQIQTASAGGAEYLQTRYLRTDKVSVILGMEQEEAVTTPHVAETIGYLAIEAGSGLWNDMTYEAGITPAAVFSNPYDLNYTASYDAVPRILTNLASYHALDNAHLRFENATTNDVQIKVGEDTTFDTELDHFTPETVAYLAIEGDGMLTALEEQRPIGEVGTLTNLTDVPQTVVLERSYNNPVVFAQSVSTQGLAPVVVRVTNVQSDRFDLFLAEPSNENGTHTAETVSFVVLEAGTHQLLDGTRIEIGTLDTTATVGRMISNQWEQVSFTSPFTETPVVLTQIQTTNVGRVGFLKIRQNSTDADGLSVALEPEESSTGQHAAPETIGYLAIEAGAGTWGTFTYDAGNVPSVADQFTSHTFGVTNFASPAFLSSMGSYTGQDNGHVRYINLTGSGVQLKIDEDTTVDTEKTHSEETVSYLVLGGQGTLLASVPLVDIGEIGQIFDLTNVPQIVPLLGEYTNPVVFAQSASGNGGQPVAVRIRNVQATQFEIYLTEPSDQDGTHGAETVSYLVLEAGTHQLHDGKLLEVGTVTTNATVGTNISPVWETVNFATTFNSSPVVLSQIQTASVGGDDYLNVRHQSESASNVVLALELEESATTARPLETVGYLAIEPGSGLWSGLFFEVNKTAAVVTDVWNTHSFDNVYLDPPALLSNLATYNGTNNSNLRYNNLTASNVQFKASEDTTFDTEVLHLSPESVAYLAISGSGPVTAVAPITPPQVALEEQRPIGEVGTLTNLTDVPQTVVLERSYNNPVVFAQSVSTQGLAPVVVRVTNVQSDRFDLFLAEPSNENGTHTAETVSFVVLEAGTHQLLDGTRIEIGTLDTTATVGRMISNQWEQVSFTSPFTETPVVLTQIQTTNVGRVGFLKIRQNSTDADGLSVALEPEESSTGQHAAPETIGYLAIEAGAGTWGTFTYDAGNVPSVADQFTSHTFGVTNFASPAFLSSMGSYTGQDNGHVRYINLTGSGVQLKIDEDTTVDTEKTHSEETVSYLVLGGQGTLLASVPLVDIGEIGQIFDLTNVPQIVPLLGEYTNPVVFAQSASGNGGQPVAVRIRNVQATQFEIYLTEPSDQDGTHGAETVSYLVLEAGTHQLHDGKLLEVGTVTTNATVGTNISPVWETVNFATTFNSSPVVLSQIQTASVGGDDYLNVRHQSESASNVVLALELEESATTARPLETVGYLAIEPGSGLWSGLFFEVNKTAAVVTDVWNTHSFDNVYLDPPALLSNLATYNGTNNSNLRYNNLTASNVQFKASEDTTFDTEVLHLSPESVAYLAISGSGPVTAVAPITPPQVASIVRDGGDDQYDQLSTLVYTFSMDVNLTADALQLTMNSGSGSAVNLPGIGFNYDANSRTATWNFSTLPALSAAWHTATLDSAKVIATVNGKMLDGDGDGTEGDDHAHHLLVARPGDANLDGYVDIVDFNTLAQGFDPTGVNAGNDWFAANFDGDADVDIHDFIQVVRNYSPLGYATSAVSVASSSSTALLTMANSARHEIQASETLVAGDSATVNTHGEQVATDQVFSNWDDQTDETLFLSDIAVRRRHGAPLRESDFSWAAHT